MKTEGKLRLLLFVAASILFIVVGPVFSGRDSGELPPALKDIIIRDGFFKSQFKEAGTVTKITGKGRLLVVRRATHEAYYAKEGNPLYENDALYTLHDCKCRVTLKDRNVVILAPDSHLDIDEVHAGLIEGKRKSLLAMAKGKAIFYILKLFTYKNTSLNLKTPTATIGVRGTKFGTEIKQIKKIDASYNQRPLVASLNPVLLGEGTEKENSITRVYVFEGEVDVTSLIDQSSKRLHENEILEANPRGLGEVVFDPEGTKAFNKEVLSGIMSMPDNEPPILNKKPEHGSMEMREQMEDVKQRERVPTIQDEYHHPHNEP